TADSAVGPFTRGAQGVGAWLGRLGQSSIVGGDSFGSRVRGERTAEPSRSSPGDRRPGPSGTRRETPVLSGRRPTRRRRGWPAIAELAPAGRVRLRRTGVTVVGDGPAIVPE